MQAILGLFARHILTALGAILVSKGIADTATADAFVEAAAPIVGGAVTAGAGLVWSYIQKKKSGAIPPR